jgi:hypothetical protein
MTTSEKRTRRMDIRRQLDNRTGEPSTSRSPEHRGADYSAHFACLSCCKSFKRAVSGHRPGDPWPDHLPCPDCGRPSLNFGRKFKPPKKSDVQQWRKVRLLSQHGFWFQSIGVPYPESYSEAEEFVVTYSKLGRPVDSKLWEQISSGW